MREIKFRGRDLDTGKFVYGDFVHCVPMSSFPGIVDDDGSVHEIYFDSVAQLIGRDSNGDEVYEGDKLTDSQGNTYIAKFDSVAEWQINGMPVSDIECFFDLDELTLKEAAT